MIVFKGFIFDRFSMFSFQVNTRPSSDIKITIRHSSKIENEQFKLKMKFLSWKVKFAKVSIYTFFIFLLFGK